MIEIGPIILAAKEKPKQEAFSFALSQIPDALLTQTLESIGPNKEEGPSAVISTLLGIFLRGHLHGGKDGGFEASEDDLTDIINTMTPYFVLELVRRRGCFGFFELPESPWAFDAQVRAREPHRATIEATVEELRQLKAPIFPLLLDKDLKRMEEENIGAVVPMPVQGRSVATDAMLNIQPHKTPALDPATFIKALQAVNQRASSTAPVPQLNLLASMASNEVDLMDEKTGKTRRLNIAEMNASPEGRMVQIMHEFFGHSWEENRSAVLRFYALMKLVESGALSEWTLQKSGGTAVHTAVFIAAATEKLTKGGGFAPARFLDEVKRLASSRQTT